MINLRIEKTAKGYGKDEEWSRFDTEFKTFTSLQFAHDWIKRTYGKSRRSPIYITDQDGQAIKIGYVIGFRNADWSHSPVNHWLQQDWIEFREVQPIKID